MEYLIAWLAIAVFTGAIASSKGRNGFGWFILGCLFSLLALIAAAAMPGIKQDPNAPRPDTHVRCPDCKELVLKEARKCKHCGCALVPDSEQPRGG